VNRHFVAYFRASIVFRRDVYGSALPYHVILLPFFSIPVFTRADRIPGRLGVRLLVPTL
jgi:hypothetical protein